MERMIPITVDNDTIGVVLINNKGEKTVLLNVMDVKHASTINSSDFERMFPDL